MQLMFYVCLYWREAELWAFWWRTVEGWIMGWLWMSSAKVQKHKKTNDFRDAQVEARFSENLEYNQLHAIFYFFLEETENGIDSYFQVLLVMLS